MLPSLSNLTFNISNGTKISFKYIQDQKQIPSSFERPITYNKTSLKKYIRKENAINLNNVEDIQQLTKYLSLNTGDHFK